MTAIALANRTRRTLLVSAALLAAGACGRDAPAFDRATGNAIIVTTTASPTTDAPPEPTGIATTASAPATGSAPEPVVGDPVVSSVLVAEVAQPIDLVARPGDTALYVVEQAGRVVRIDDGDVTVMADLGGRITVGGERGLLGLEYSADGGLAYLDYTDVAGDTVVAEYPVAPDGTIDVAAERVLLTVAQPYGNHNAGDLDRGPDGMLWITLGDGGSGGDPERRASDPSSLLGSLLRIDPNPDGDRPYGIPPDNPFAAGEFGGVAGAPEVWAWGLRNPWKIAFDPVTHDLWIGDVGQNEYEEIDMVASIDGALPARGANFGWSAFEGTTRFNADVPDPGTTTFPVLVYPHGDDGCSISGGVPYRGTAIPDLAPAYLYSDFCSGRLWALDLASGRNLNLLTGFEGVTAVRAGPDGEPYVLEIGGGVHRIVPG